jgi:putative transposase
MDRIHARIDALSASERALPDIVEEVARLGAQLLMRAALETEVTEFLGRDRDQRAATTAQARPGSRNGFQPVTVTTTAGPVTLERPKLRGTTAAFASRLFGKHVTITNALESLVIASLVRGLSATYPAAMKILLTDAAGLTSSLRFPTEHHTRTALQLHRTHPSVRPAAAPKSSAASPARPPASASSGPSWTGPQPAGAA